MVRVQTATTTATDQERSNDIDHEVLQFRSTTSTYMSGPLATSPVDGIPPQVMRGIRDERHERGQLQEHER